MIGIIDYGLGNIYSIQKACNKVSLDSKIVSSPEMIKNYDAILLPGVGAFGDAMETLNNSGLKEAIIDFKNSGKFLVGICLGMQLFLSKSYEFGEHKGFDLVKGSCEKFSKEYKNERCIIPQITWNNVYINNYAMQSKLFDGLNSGVYMYFIHSFYTNPEDKSIVTSTTKYAGIEYCSSFKSENLLGLQFHPEKSGIEGLKIYDNLRKLIYK